MRSLNTFQATVSLGLKEGYEGAEHSLAEVEEVCQKYCDEVKTAVTITPTKFIYVGGSEQGCLIGFINYPRFPDKEPAIKNKAIALAKILKTRFNQYRISVVCTDKTYLIED